MTPQNKEGRSIRLTSSAQRRGQHGDQATEFVAFVARMLFVSIRVL